MFIRRARRACRRRNDMRKTMLKEDMKEFEKSEILGVVSTIDADGYPRVTLLTTLMAKDEKTLVMGQFTKGISKENMLIRPKSGFAFVTMKMDFWHGLVNWRDKFATEGPEYVKYNNMQMWRFNTYFGIEKVYYGDLVGISDKAHLDLLGIGLNYAKINLSKKKFLSGKKEQVMRPFAVDLFNGLANPKFLTFVNADGYPVIVPVVQAQSAGSDRVVFTAKPYACLTKGLEKGAKVGVSAVSMQLESVLVQGVFSGFEKGTGYVDIEKVYNNKKLINKGHSLFARIFGLSRD